MAHWAFLPNFKAHLSPNFRAQIKDPKQANILRPMTVLVEVWTAAFLSIHGQLPRVAPMP